MALLVGGGVAPFVYDHATAERLGRQTSELAAADGGSVLISTSPRTPPATIDTLCAHLTVPFYLFRWRKDAAENPFYGMLAVADAIVVTGDSMSMLTEGCATGKPVHIFDLGVGAETMRPGSATAPQQSETPRRGSVRMTVRTKECLHRLIKRLTPARLSRDIRVIHRYFVEAGEAVWLGDPLPASRPSEGIDGVARAVVRVRALFAGEPAAEREIAVAFTGGLADIARASEYAWMQRKLPVIVAGLVLLAVVAAGRFWSTATRCWRGLQAYQSGLATWVAVHPLLGPGLFLSASCSAR